MLNSACSCTLLHQKCVMYINIYHMNLKIYQHLMQGSATYGTHATVGTRDVHYGTSRAAMSNPNGLLSQICAAILTRAVH